MYIIVTTIQIACGPHCFFTAHMNDLESLRFVVQHLLLLDKNKFQKKQIMLTNLVQPHDYCIFVVSKMEIQKGGEDLFLTLMVLVLVTAFLCFFEFN